MGSWRSKHGRSCNRLDGDESDIVFGRCSFFANVVSTVVVAIPLVFAEGPGQASRNVLGIVILFGVTISAILTLFVIPGFYKLLARRTKSPEAVTKELVKLQQAVKKD